MKPSRHWYRIKDPKVLKPGMRIQSCLDMQNVGTDNGEEDWFEAEIVRIDPAFEEDSLKGCEVVVHRDDFRDDETWCIILTDKNMQHFFVYFKEWDD